MKSKINSELYLVLHIITLNVMQLIIHMSFRATIGVPKGHYPVPGQV